MIILKNKTNFCIYILLITLFSIAIVASHSTQNVNAENEAVDGNWDAHLIISEGEAIRPAIAVAPNGKTVIVTYTESNLGDPYYSFSTNFGKSNSWTKHKAVYSSAASSAQPDVAMDNSNNAHVVWVENGGLAYKKINNLSAGTGPIIKFFADSIIDAGSGVLNPHIVIYNQFVHIIGITDSGSLFTDAFHVYSTDGGANWSSANYITNHPLTVERPAVTVDSNGSLHVVYNQQVLPNLLRSVNYAKGTLNGSVITWNPANHIDITGKIPAGNYEILEPSIIYANGRLEVSATQKNDPASGLNSPQYVYYFQCAGTCTNANNWNPLRISGTTLYINESPHEVISSIVRLGSCINVVFDGKRTSLSGSSEQVYTSSNCNGWGNGRQELTPDDQTRRIQPAAATHNNWYMYVAYEEFSNTSHKVYFVRNIPGVYLPVIIK